MRRVFCNPGQRNDSYNDAMMITISTQGLSDIRHAVVFRYNTCRASFCAASGLALFASCGTFEMIRSLVHSAPGDIIIITFDIIDHLPQLP